MAPVRVWSKGLRRSLTSSRAPRRGAASAATAKATSRLSAGLAVLGLRSGACSSTPSVRIGGSIGLSSSPARQTMAGSSSGTEASGGDAGQGQWGSWPVRPSCRSVIRCSEWRQESYGRQKRALAPNLDETPAAEAAVPGRAGAWRRGATWLVCVRHLVTINCFDNSHVHRGRDCPA